MLCARHSITPSLCLCGAKPMPIRANYPCATCQRETRSASRATLGPVADRGAPQDWHACEPGGLLQVDDDIEHFKEHAQRGGGLRAGQNVHRERRSSNGSAFQPGRTVSHEPIRKAGRVLQAIDSTSMDGRPARVPRLAILALVESLTPRARCGGPRRQDARRARPRRAATSGHCETNTFTHRTKTSLALACARRPRMSRQGARPPRPGAGCASHYACSMRKVVAAVVAIASVAVLAARPARAGCNNTCDMVLDAVSAAPPLPTCARATLSSQTCLCEVWLMLTNACTTPLDTVDFGFRGCPEGGPCSVPPSAQNSVALAVDSAGKKQWLLHVRQDNVDYALTISATITDFNGSPGGCQAGGGSRRIGDPIALAAVLAALMGCVFRRRRCISARTVPSTTARASVSPTPHGPASTCPRSTARRRGQTREEARGGLCRGCAFKLRERAAMRREHMRWRRGQRYFCGSNARRNQGMTRRTFQSRESATLAHG
jgi:hypothetical protein